MPSKVIQNWDFWFENKPSGNPDREKLFLELISRGEIEADQLNRLCSTIHT
jgi:hypothetical protein